MRHAVPSLAEAAGGTVSRSRARPERRRRAARRSGAAPSRRPTGEPGDARSHRRGIETFHVQGNVYMLVGAGANIAVQIGDDGVLVVDTGGGADARARCWRRSGSCRTSRSAGSSTRVPIADHTGGNEAISQAGQTVNGNPAAIIAHENVLARMTQAEACRSRERGRPTPTSRRRAILFNGEAVMLYHDPARAHRRRLDRLLPPLRRASSPATLFVTTTYPGDRCDERRQRQGVDRGAQPHARHRGAEAPAGRRHVRHPGPRPHLRRSRRRSSTATWSTIVRDRIAGHGEAQGMTLEQVKAAKPTLDYDGRYGADSGLVDDGDVHRGDLQATQSARRRSGKRAGGCEVSAHRICARRGVARSSCARRASRSPARPSRQPRRPRRRGRREALAPIDLTGYWVAVVTEDWRWRMLTPPKGDYASVPLNAEAPRRPTRGISRRTTRRACSARRSASAASCASRAGCTSRGRTTTR